jgi:proteasome-associated ATPase
MFDRYTGNRRLVLNARDEEIVVSPIGELCHVDLQNGDKIRYDSAAWIAYERIEQSKGEHFFLEETPRISFADIGGLDEQIDKLVRLPTEQG